MATSIIDKVLGYIAPGTALSRARNRAALSVLTGATAHYDAATAGSRSASWRPVASDADTASAQRSRVSYVVRDMIRNTAFAARGQQVIANNVVGDGIIPKIVTDDDALRADFLSRIEEHFDTVAIDAGGRNNLYGLQRLAMNTVVESGEVLIRRRRRLPRDGFALNFQVEVLEPDYLNTHLSGTLPDGNTVREGIEFDKIGRRVAYHLYGEHPGALHSYGNRDSRRVPASEVLHIFRQDRPGQQRGVSWFAPVALQLQDMADHQDAQLMRQKIAACFAGFRVNLDGDPAGDSDAGLTSITPGRIQNLAPGEDIRFTAPPGVEGYDEFTQHVLRAVAAGLGVTYEALTGDMTNANFSSARMGRMEMDRNVSSWQWLLMIPQMLQPIGAWAIEEWAQARMRPTDGLRLEWVPPHRVLVDPTREIPALAKKVRAGFASRGSVVRELGYDPERVLDDIAADAKAADEYQLIFDTDPRRTSGAGVWQETDAGDTTDD